VELLSPRVTQNQSDLLTFRELNRADDLRRYFMLRQMVFAEQGYWPTDAPRVSLDVDSFDRHSRFIGAFTVSGELVGGARIILAQDTPNAAVIESLLQEHGCVTPPARDRTYHAQRWFNFDAVIGHVQSQGKQVVEFGRTVIHAAWQNKRVGHLLLHAVHGLARCHGISVGLAVVPPRLARFYSSAGCRVLHRRGPSRSPELNAEVVPVVLELSRLEGPFRVALRAERCLHLKGEWRSSTHSANPEESAENLVDWAGNPRGGHGWEPVLSRLPLLRSGVSLHDETLRDGLQSPSAVNPPLEAKTSLLHHMVELGIESANLGLPAAGGAARKHSEELLQYVAAQHLPLLPTLAGRTLPEDVDAIVEASQNAGLAVEAGLFLGCSPIRQACEDWDFPRLLAFTEKAVSHAVAQGLQVMFVTEDTTRTPAHILEPLYHTALQAGASAICLTDTVGYATPRGTGKLVSHVKNFLGQHGYSARLDWHGHNDRGLGVANCLAAIEAGVDRVHATLGGCGERVGNARLEELLVHLARLSGRPLCSDSLEEYLLWGRRHLPWVPLSPARSTPVQPSRVAALGAAG
jgi:GNAT superfamily N-acetyltransferase